MSNIDGKQRENIKPGLHVFIVQKQDQHTEKLTEGYVKDILTNSPTHPHGIKVRIETGEVGRVKPHTFTGVAPSGASPQAKGDTLRSNPPSLPLAFGGGELR